MFLQPSFSKLWSSSLTANNTTGSFLPEGACVFSPLLLNSCVQVGCDACREGSLKSSGVEELWACVQCLEQGWHLDAPCSFLCIFPLVNVFVLSPNKARALFGLSASIREPHERMFRAVCQNPCGEGEHPLLMDLFPGCLVSSLPATECLWLGWEECLNSLHLVDAEA